MIFDEDGDEKISWPVVHGILLYDTTIIHPLCNRHVVLHERESRRVYIRINAMNVRRCIPQLNISGEMACQVMVELIAEKIVVAGIDKSCFLESEVLSMK